MADHDVTIQLLGPGDESVLKHTADGVFDHAVQSRLVIEFLNDPRHHVVVALLEDRVVGFVSGVHYVHPDKPAELFVNEVGVAPAHQRQGIAKRLVTAILAHAATLGCGEAWVLAEHDNAAARKLYASLGANEHESVLCSLPIPDKPHAT